MSDALVEAPPPAQANACSVCGRTWGDGVACQYCDQIGGMETGMKLASVGRRLCGWLLDGLLLIVTLFIGWAVWTLIVWGRGQTPGKQLVGVYCVTLTDARRATWGTMCLREFVGKFLLMWFLGMVTLGIVPLILYFRIIWNKNRQEVWDSIAGTIVVRHDPGLITSAPEVLSSSPETLPQ